eukprot:755038-Hanusia_phi.AAC.1
MVAVCTKWRLGLLLCVFWVEEGSSYVLRPLRLRGGSVASPPKMLELHKQSFKMAAESAEQKSSDPGQIKLLCSLFDAE